MLVSKPRFLRCSRLGWIVLALVFSTQIHASDYTGYVGLSLGSTEVNFKNVQTAAGATLDGEDSAFKIFGGVNLHENFALEGSYIDFGEAVLTMPFGSVLTVNGVSVVSIGATGVAKSTADALALAGVVKGDVGIAEFFFKGGMHRWESEFTSNFSNVANSSTDGFDLFFGLGTNIEVSDAFAIRLEFENYTLEDDDIDVMTLGGIYRF